MKYHSHKPFAILRPVSCPPPEVDAADILAAGEICVDFHSDFGEVVVDIETEGTEFWDDERRIVGIGLAWFSSPTDIQAKYIQWRTLSEESKDKLLHRLSQVDCTAYNMFFDAAHIRRECMDRGIPDPMWTSCTYFMYRQLATEHFKKQEWGLKSAEVDLLLWENSNEVELDDWLMAAGYTKKTKRDGVQVTVPDKGKMHLAPPEVLGKYCILDCIATLMLRYEVFEPHLQQFPVLRDMHYKYVPTYISLHIDQVIEGIRVDMDLLRAHREGLLRVMQLANVDIRQSPIAPFIEEYERSLRKELIDKEPEKFLVRKLGKEPVKLKKNGEISSAWLKWDEKRNKPPVVSKNWEKWDLKRQKAERGELDTYSFRISSGKDLREVIYNSGYVSYTKTEKTKKKKGKDIPIYEVIGKYGSVELLGTEGGDTPMNGDFYSQLDDAVGKPLQAYSDAEQEIGYVDTYLEVARLHEDGTWRIHPSWIMHGTVTGRLAGGGGSGINIQQCFHPKTRILTKRGWVPVLDLTLEDEVWQVDPTDATHVTGSWVNPISVSSREYSGEMYTFGNMRGSISVTEEHRMLWFGGTNQPQLVETVSAVDSFKRPKQRRYLKQATQSSDRTPSHSERDIWLACMIQADGSVKKGRPGVYTLGVSKPRKREKVAALLGRRGNVYKPTGTQRQEVEVWNYIKINSPLITNGKSLHLEHLSGVHADTLVEALTFWDGNSRNTSNGRVEYSTTDLYSAEQVQCYLVRNGYEARICKYRNCYRVCIKKATRIELSTEEVKTNHYSGKVGCLSVPSSYVLAESEGQTFLIGQCPKTIQFLKCFIPDEGMIWGEQDWSALEPHVLAEVSQDPTLLKLYGPGSKKHDVYLFNGAHYEVIKDVVAKHYDVDNPDTAAAKKACKSERDLCKIITLAKTYKGGAYTIWANARLQGINITLEQAKTISNSHDELYRVSGKEFHDQLLAEWKRRGGWILSPTGRPIGVDERKEKDLTSSIIQSGGHDVHMMFICELHWILSREGIPHMGVIWDFHDQSIVSIPEECGEKYLECVEKARVHINDLLGATIELKTTPKLSRDMSHAKEAEYNWEDVKGYVV